jgi:hypothetical protein
MHHCEKVAVVLASLLTLATHVRARITGRGTRDDLIIAPIKETPFLKFGCRQGVDLCAIHRVLPAEDLANAIELH